MKLETLLEQPQTIHTNDDGDQFVYTEAGMDVAIKFSHDPSYTSEFERLMGADAFQQALKANMQAALRKTMQDLRLGGNQWTDDHEITSIQVGRII